MKNRNSRVRGLIYGVGVNDAEYTTQIFESNGGRRRAKWICPKYQTWKDMMTRCYSPKAPSRSPSYVGCKVSADWHRFSSFKSWMEDQDWQGNQIDKDIILEGNRIYSEETCLFVSRAINSFFKNGIRRDTDLPMGVFFRKESGKFRAQCKNPFTGRYENIGHYETPEMAHQAWRSRKHEIALIYAKTEKDPRVRRALLTRFS